ncbi:MAG: ATP-binding protein [Anaerolineaceae bacterium]|nr:MAG: ATP-binding protein [Anaerolineaceae bacterium]
MLPEISLNILDIANNSISAGADLVIIEVRIYKEKDQLTVKITDNGRGMTDEQISKVGDPFFTTRNTRDVGLGIPFLKQAAEITGGSIVIESIPYKSTIINASFGLSHIDRMPLGDICSTIYALIMANQSIDFLYIYECEGKEYQLDTRNLRQILGDVQFDRPEVAEFIRSFLKENQEEVDGGN